MPDAIEGQLYLLHQRDDGIEKHHDARADDIVALGILDVIVYEVDDSLCHNGLRLEGGGNPRLQQRCVSEPSGNDKQHRHEGDERHEGGESKSRHIPRPHILDIEYADGEHHALAEATISIEQLHTFLSFITCKYTIINRTHHRSGAFFTDNYHIEWVSTLKSH